MLRIKHNLRARSKKKLFLKYIDPHLGGVGVFCLLMVLSCTTAPKAPKFSPEQKVKQESLWGEDVSQVIQSKLKIKKESSIQDFLKEVTRRVGSSHEELKYFHNEVFLVQNEIPIGATPSAKFYIPVSVLKKIEYENELAALFSLQMSSLLKGLLSKKIKTEDRSENPAEWKKQLASLDPSVFRLSAVDIQSLMAQSLNLMYEAGYDLRGMIVYLEKIGASSAVVETARNAISNYVPIRNPLVKTEKFIDIIKRIKKL